MSNHETVPERQIPRYAVFLHEDIHDRFDAQINFPKIIVEPNQSHLIRIRKTNVSSISSPESVCTDQPHYGPQRCKEIEVK